MITTPQEFEDSTAFELYVLEKVRPPLEQHGVDSIDLRDEEKTAVSSSICVSVCASAVEQLKDELTPLLFGAAWKVIDLLLEFALNNRGLSPKSQDWKITEKQNHARNGAGNRCVLGCSPPVWDALLQVYAATVEHRHCLVHRTASIDAAGTLNGVDRNQQPLTPLSRKEQIAFAKAANLVARAVIAGGITLRSEDHLKFQLDQLTNHSRVIAFGVGEPNAPVEILLSLTNENGQIVLDMSGILERAKKTMPMVHHFDVLMDVPDGSGRRLFAYAENCPEGRSVIDLAALLPWLEYR
ncbi:hypothetical protein [Azovibrio restrictus]|uniref:hypothetical protein n=1 Tax=Azovibrio restrictus TaxID=146938 RepID=UPI0012EBA0A8|nr:hypothetical protein [Azovibrio restrictus]